MSALLTFSLASCLYFKKNLRQVSLRLPIQRIPFSMEGNKYHTKSMWAACMHACMRIHACIHSYSCIHIHACMHSYSCMHLLGVIAYMRESVHEECAACMHIQMHKCMHECMHECMQRLKGSCCWSGTNCGWVCWWMQLGCISTYLAK